MNLEKISYDNLVIAIVIRSNIVFEEDINFLTKDDDILQVGYMKRPKDIFTIHLKEKS